MEIEKFRGFDHVTFSLGKCITAISGRNATQKTTLLGLIGQPFTISRGHPMYGCKTIDGYNFRSQFREKFKISSEHDIIGQHKWKLELSNGVYNNRYYTVESIARRQRGQKPTLRFWNAESRARGAGYIQLPVYFLSLSRLFPIGETGKTQSISCKLTPDELDYCIVNYRTILSIQQTSKNYSVGIEKGLRQRHFLELVMILMIFLPTQPEKEMLQELFWRCFHLNDCRNNTEKTIRVVSFLSMS